MNAGSSASGIGGVGGGGGDRQRCRGAGGSQRRTRFPSASTRGRRPRLLTRSSSAAALTLVPAGAVTTSLCVRVTQWRGREKARGVGGMEWRLRWLSKQAACATHHRRRCCCCFLMACASHQAPTPSQQLRVLLISA